MLTLDRTTARRGFTLIELLIVIAIILILIAIALPNFLEAQERARVTRAKAELRNHGNGPSIRTSLTTGFCIPTSTDSFLVTTITRNKRTVGKRTLQCLQRAGFTDLKASHSRSIRPGFYAPNVHCPPHHADQVYRCQRNNRSLGRWVGSDRDGFARGQPASWTQTQPGKWEYDHLLCVLRFRSGPELWGLDPGFRWTVWCRV